LTGARAALLDAGGRLLGSGRRPLETSYAAGRAEQDPRAWVSAALAAAREAVGRAEGVDVAAIGVGALGPAPILLDDGLEPLTPALLFSLDRRAENQRARLAVGPDHALPKLLWWQEHEPQLLRRAAWAVDATGYIVCALTGKPTMDSITRADYECADAGAPVRLPQPVDPLAIAGRLGDDVARELGLPSGTPVAAGTYDTYVDILGSGARAGDGCLLLGSTLAVYAVVSEQRSAPGLELSPLPGGEAFLLGGTTSTAGTALAWLARLLGTDEAELAASAAKLEPGRTGLLALPYLAGERAPLWDSAARGALVGLTLETSQDEVYRALVDALALAAYAIAERLPRRNRWRASGGGSRNEAWLQATCDALGEPVTVTAYAGEAVGPAALALRAVGLDPAVGVAAEVRPDAERSRRLRSLHGRQRELYERLRPLMTAAPW
jgi:xylulokinase